MNGLYYDFQGVGKYTLLRSDDGQLLVQTRMEGPGATLNTAVATKVGSKRINVRLPDNELLVDGVVVTDPQVDLSLEGGRLIRNSNQYLISWDTGDIISLLVHSYYIDVRAQLDPSRAGKVSGLLGNFDGDPKNDIRSASGRILEGAPYVDVADLYGVYGDSWRITQKESLFDYRPGESTATFTDRSRQPLTREQILANDPKKAAEARAACEAAGVTSPILLDACQFDVFATGDLGLIAIYVERNFLVNPNVSAVVEGSLPLDKMDKNLVLYLRGITNNRNNPIFPSDLANILDIVLPDIASLRGLETAKFTGLKAITIRERQALTSLEGLPAELPNLQSLEISRNEAMTSLAGLPTELPNLQSLRIIGNPAMTSLAGLPTELPNLQSLRIIGNPAMTSLEGLPAKLNMFKLKISYNDSLTDLTGLGAIEMPGLGLLEISYNSSLKNLAGLPPQLPILRDLFVMNNPNLSSLTGLPAELPNLAFLIIDQPDSRLTSLEGLPAQLPPSLLPPGSGSALAFTAIFPEELLCTATPGQFPESWNSYLSGLSCPGR